LYLEIGDCGLEGENRLKKPLIGLEIALGVLAACFLAVMAGGMAGSIMGHLGGPRAAHPALTRLS